MEYRLPYDGKVKITTLYGKKGSWKCGWHTGVDFVGLEDKKIRAIADGEVVFKKTSSSYGNYVRVKHPDGLISLYAHMSSFNVNVGDKVKAGDVLGIEGNTGHSFGSHLHLEVHKNTYRYPNGYTPETAVWMKDPCKVLGIDRKLGVIKVKADVTETNLLLCGKMVKVNRILQDGKNYVELRSLECDDIGIDYDAGKKLPVLYLKEKE